MHTNHKTIQVAEIVAAKGWRRDYPLFWRVHEIISGLRPAASVVGFAEEAVRQQEERRAAGGAPSSSGGDESDGFDLAGRGFGAAGAGVPPAAATASLDESLGAFVPRARRGRAGAAAAEGAGGGGASVAGFNGASSSVDGGGAQR